MHVPGAERDHGLAASCAHTLAGGGSESGALSEYPADGGLIEADRAIGGLHPKGDLSGGDALSFLQSPYLTPAVRKHPRQQSAHFHDATKHACALGRKLDGDDRVDAFVAKDGQASLQIDIGGFSDENGTRYLKICIDHADPTRFGWPESGEPGI